MASNNGRQRISQKFHQKISEIKTNSFDWELLIFDAVKKEFILAFQFMFCLENRSVCKGVFVFVMITEIV